MYIVSACLLGANCKYDGGNNDNEAVKDFCEGHKILAVCPETEGGLKSPRSPAEQVRVPVSNASDREGSSNQGIDDESSTDNETEIRVMNSKGEDVTEYFRRGAELCMEKVMAGCGNPEQHSYEEPELAILKANSPSCGSGCVYDGTFTHTLIEGDGVFAELLKKAGIRILTEEDFVAH